MPPRSPALALLVLLAACTPPEKRFEAGPGACEGDCPGAAVDGGTTKSDGGFQPDAQAEGGVRSELCAKGCNPDPDAALSSCDPKPSPGEPGVTGLSCRIQRAEDGEPIAACDFPGEGAEGALCQGGEACRPGLACAVHPEDKGLGAGRCRRYCCDGEGCATGTYCGLLPVFEPTKPFPDPLLIPACAPATGCQLLDPSSCSAGQTCTLVNDQTTTCVTPGAGLDGDPCPCGAGMVCSPAKVCRTLCRLGATAGCGGGACVVGGSGFPAGFGVCAG
ncbi:MAG: hypothetical protein IT374_05875 [Polyangiaceae bacterium]|nr:hypothetical protein [Polyangiaceae bacterium]